MNCCPSFLKPRSKNTATKSTVDNVGRLKATGPDAVEVSGRHLRVGDGFTATLAVTGYPAEVSAGWLEPLLGYPGRLEVAIHVEPVAPQVAADRLRKQRARLESNRRGDAAKGRLDNPEVEAAADDAADLAGRLARGEGRLFRAAIYITVHADEPGELAERVTEVRALASSLLLGTQPVTWRQLQGWTATLPLAVDPLKMTRTFDTTALAASFPFNSPDLPLPGEGGIFYGLNASSPGAVCWNRWQQDNHNMIILATSGSGKSYLAKLDLVRNLYIGVSACVIDPEDEYVPLALAVGGVIIRPGTPGVKINPLDIPATGSADELTRRCLFMHTFIDVLLAGAVGPNETAALDKAVLAAYSSRGITFDPRTWRRQPPLLADLADQLELQGEPGRLLAARLAPYVSGSFRGLFDGHTTHEPTGHLVVYAIKDLPQELKAVGTLLTLDAIARRVTSRTRDGAGPPDRLLVLIDEAWLLLRDGAGADFLLRLAKSARKYAAGLTVVTQDIADVLSTDIGRAVVSNSATQILLRQAPQAIAAVTESFGLTDGERAFLSSAPKGHALLSGANTKIAFVAEADEFEASLVSTTSPQAALAGAGGDR